MCVSDNKAAIPQSQSHFCCLPARPPLTRGTSALKREPVTEGRWRGVGVQNRSRDIDTETRIETKIGRNKERGTTVRIRKEGQWKKWKRK